MSDNDAVFQSLNFEMSDAVLSGLGTDIHDMRRQVEQNVRRFTDQTINTLLMSFGRSSAPPFVSGGWPAYSKRYAQRKNGGELAEGFYTARMGLKEAVAGVNVDRAFGRPITHVRPETYSGALHPGIALNSRGQPYWKAGSGGRGFASYAEAFTRLTFEIEVDLFPKINDMQIPDIINAMISGKEAQKFIWNEFGTKRASARPLLQPFLEWYTGPFFDKYMRRLFGNVTS